MKTVRKMTNQTSPCSIYLITLTTIPSFLFHLYIINVKNISLWLANSSKQPCPVAIPATLPPPPPLSQNRNSWIYININNYTNSNVTEGYTQMSESILISTISQTAMQQKILVNHSSSVITTLKFLSLFPYKQLHKQQCNKRFGYIIHHM